ncbi:hypothetical protein ACVFI8_18860 [Agarivorans sp. MS3-6]|uniref:hypothetical protein n=1 Tax=Agarivorans sp. TSD2052 TaxID=2937286 RepID=UPI00200C357A|nr:hypothetical protein [Agarivorans sp. TSD2052]UPW17101.1 hypothetical protein M0C34_12670 [Agarivorans sp. TSD2052]
MNIYKTIIVTSLFATTSLSGYAAEIYLSPFGDGVYTGKASALSIVSESHSELYNGTCDTNGCMPNDSSTFSNSGTGGLMGLLPYTSGLETLNLGEDWLLDLEYQGLSGSYIDGVANYDNYTSFGFHLHNTATQETVKIAELELVDGHLEVGNSHIGGFFNYDWYQPGVDDDLTENFFNITTGGMDASIYELWQQGVEIAWRWDFNIAGAEEMAYRGDEELASREVSITGEMTIHAVDEPSTLAILGLGLVLLSGFSRRRLS